MAQSPKHKVFISFQETDIEYKQAFVNGMGKRIVDESVDTGDIIDTGLKTATVRQKIRDEYIKDATVTVVLIGPCTWQRKHVDWEIGSSIRKSKSNSRCGLLGIILPNHPDYGKEEYQFRLIPPRLADNCQGDDPYARIYDWPQPWAPAKVAQWVHSAFLRRDGTPPNSSRVFFPRNRSGNCSQGWQG